MRDSPILGLFAREGYEQHDTHGRDPFRSWPSDSELAAYQPPSPAVPAPKKPTPRIPRHAPSAAQGIATVLVVIACSILAAMGLVSFVSQVTS